MLLILSETLKLSLNNLWFIFNIIWFLIKYNKWHHEQEIIDCSMK